MNVIRQAPNTAAVSLRTSHPPNRRFARSGQMVDCLRNELLYSEKRPRDLIFTATEQLLCDHRAAPMLVVRFARNVTERARTLAIAAGFNFANWETTGKAVVRAMLGA